MLIASISVFISFVWPEVEAVRTLSAESKNGLEDLNLIKEKKDNIRGLDQDLGKNSDKEELVNSYFPKVRNEERIIDAIYYLAANSSVSLANISIAGDPLKGEDEVDGPKSVFSSQSPQAGELPGAADQRTLPSSARSVDVEIFVAGTYENIKTFLSAVNSMEMMNDVTGVDISSQSAGEEGESSGFLSAQVKAKFYYMRNTRADNNYKLAVLDSSEFDFSQVEKVKAFISQGIPKLEVGEKGMKNPFFAL
ncbi:MAG: hypothetical protein UY41_C0013G0011 [Candidatus Moranbacteria bacterium GW2011_GWE1_49_15]|nr:MAG: hypothetical protein UX75_C0007G0022 [Candidatus Moranbacteria bacterium GW2011_GWE2_47_10]KKW06846.1 MAG: hypothetical protein UY41_C0013G0011 [Candidatus Moranbacteria bacterium GW2011_GWE1_49_15]